MDDSRCARGRVGRGRRRGPWSAPLRARPVARSAGAPVRRRRREAIPVSAATTRSRTPDRLCAEAVDLARAAAEEAAAPGVVGEHLGVVAEGDRVVTHFFECKEPGYRGWRWAVTVTRASRAKLVTLDETVLLPGPDALLAPEWVPWSERLRPGDMGPGDLLPTEADDLRLEPGCSGEDEPPPNSAVSEGRPERPRTRGRATPRAAVGPARGSIAAVAEELGMRPRPGAVPVRAARRGRPLGRGVRREDARWRRRRPRPASPAGSWCRSAGSLQPGVRGLRERVLARPTAGWSPSRTAAAATPRPPSCRSRHAAAACARRARRRPAPLAGRRLGRSRPTAPTGAGHCAAARHRAGPGAASCPVDAIRRSRRAIARPVS